MRHVFAVGCLLVLAVPAALAGPADTSATASDLAYAASAPGVDIASASLLVPLSPLGLTGTSGATGTDDDANAGMPSSGQRHAVLSSGRASCIDQASPAMCSGAGSGATYRGANDVVVLEVDVEVPAGHNHLGMEFVFLSEEWPSFVGSPWSDAFVAELDAHTWSSTSALSAPDNFATDQFGRALTVNSAAMGSANAVGTAFGGATCRVTNWVAAAPGPHTLYFSIMDRGDASYDSVILIDGLRTAHHDVTPAPACTTGAMVEGGDNAPPEPQPTTFEDDVKLGQGPTSVAASYNVTVQPDGSVSVEAQCHVKALGVHVTPSTCKAGI